MKSFIVLCILALTTFQAFAEVKHWRYEGSSNTNTSNAAFTAITSVDDDSLSLKYRKNKYHLVFAYNDKSTLKTGSSKAEFYLRTNRKNNSKGRYDSDYLLKGQTFVFSKSGGKTQYIVINLTKSDLAALKKYAGNDMGVSYFVNSGNWRTYTFSGKNFKPVFSKLKSVVVAHVTRKSRTPVAKVTNAKKGGISHSHGGRKHTHPLPKQGIAHRHGNGAVGVSSRVSTSNRVPYKPYKKAPSSSANNTKRADRILSNFRFSSSKCRRPDIPVFRSRSQYDNYRVGTAKRYKSCLNRKYKDDQSDFKDLIRELKGNVKVRGSKITWSLPRSCQCKNRVSELWDKMDRRADDRGRKWDRFVDRANDRISKDEGAINYAEQNPNWRSRKKQPLVKPRINIPTRPIYTTPGYY